MMSIERRQGIEQKIVRQLVADAVSAGYFISVDDGQEVLLRRSRNIEAIMQAVMTVEHDYLLIHHAGQERPFGWIKLAYGNDGWDVIRDYTINLEELLGGAARLADELDPARSSAPGGGPSSQSET